MNTRVKSVTFSAVIISFLFILPILAQDDTQTTNVSVVSENLSLREVLEDLTRQSDKQFVFRDELVDGKVITCSLRQIQLEDAVHEIMKNTDIAYKTLKPNLIVLYDKEETVRTNEENIEPLPVVDETFTPTEFTPPSLQQDIQPDYPLLAMRDGLEGSVEMNLLVDRNGDVKRAVVHRSSGYEILDIAAKEFAKKLQYDPARKEGKPIEVWVSRVMHFQLVEKAFLPSAYVDKIKSFSELAFRSSDKIKYQALRHILECHEELSEYLGQKPYLNYNRHIGLFIDPKIYQEWKELWEDWPLHYLVFHDFILRYPDSGLKSRAVNSLLYFINKDIAYIEQSEEMDPNRQGKKDEFVRAIHRFLENDYPDAITSEMRSGMAKLLVNK
jgi:TonB family protein